MNRAAVLALAWPAILAAADPYCSAVTLRFRLRREPPVYRLGETIPAEIAFRSTQPRLYTLAGAPRPRRAHVPMEEEVAVEPPAGAIDPFSRSLGIWAGSTLSNVWRGSRPLVRDIDLNEWAQFLDPGEYRLRVISTRVMNDAARKPCELESNSVALRILPHERLLFALKDEPAFAARLVGFCAGITVAYGTAFLRRGVEVILFDSHATPRVISPRAFGEFVMPAYRDIVMPGLTAAGARWLPLIIGGNTTPVLEDLIRTGATQLLCDFNGDLSRFRRRCSEEKRALRANLDPRLIFSGSPDEIRTAARALLGAAGNAPGFLLGSGVIPYDTDPVHVRAVREAVG